MINFLNNAPFTPVMFDLFGTKRLAEMDKSVSESFTKVKQDTDALYQWVSYLHQQNQQLIDQNQALKRLAEEQKFALNELKVTVQHLPKTPYEIKSLVDQFYNFEPIMQRIKHIEQKVDLLELKRERAPLAVRPLEYQSPSVSPPQSSTALKEKLMRKLARNSKDYIKNLVLGLMHKYGKMGALQLREIVVEEQGLCSKSSFYRILEEMEKEQSLHIISDGKHTVYVPSPQHAER
jgi:DNA repair exonuclease SbcCD ATPase subunit